MTFTKNWKQVIVSKGEPFQIEYLDRRFGGRTRVAFKVDDETGIVTINGHTIQELQTTLLSKAVAASSTGSSSCSFPGALAGDEIVVAIDPSGVLDLLGDASPYFGPVVLVDDEVPQLRAIPAAELMLITIVLRRSAS